MKILNILIFTFSLLSLSAQTGFQYQAVVRNDMGEVISNQAVGVQINIILENINNSAIYTESHTVTANDYGVINLVIGQGTVETGIFNEIDWSKTAFANIAMDIDGGTNYTDLGTTELLSVPKALYAETTKNMANPFGVNVRDFGAIGDNNADDTGAFQAAFAAAVTEGKRVIVPAGNYRTTETLVVPMGVMIVGEGVGASALGTPYNGSAIRFDGTGAAIQFSNDYSGMRDMLIYDQNQGSTNANGVHVLANGVGIESLRFFNVLIHYFIGGTALKLEAINGGGIAYGSYYNVRIRNAKIGLHIDDDETSFTNSNTWHHGTISGGGFDYCILADNGNNNLFYGTIIEPFQSNFGHIVVNNDAQLHCHEIRVEAAQQGEIIPTITCAEGTKNSTFTGFFGHGSILDYGNNIFNFRSGKGTFHHDTRSNLYENATFLGFDGMDLPFWDITGTGVTAEVLAPDVTPQHKVLKLSVPAGVVANLKPVVAAIPRLGSATLYNQVNFGMYVKVNAAETSYLRTNSPSGVTVSAKHPGDNQWHFIGMSADVNTTTTHDGRLEINNTTGGTLEVFVSVPTLTFGNQIPDYTAKPLTTHGGMVNGTLSTSVVEFDNNTNFIVLPKEANTFIMTGTTDIHRINDSTNDRFSKGTVITLLFDNNVGVLNSVYLALKSNFTAVPNSSLTLLSMGNGTWRELDRN